MKSDVILKKLGFFSSALSYVGAISLFIMMALTAADVVGRYIFNKPITGVFEITEFLVLILIFSFIGFTQAEKSHVSVDLLLMRFPKKFRRVVEFFNHLICLVMMAIITYMGLLKALELKAVGEATPNLQIPDYPFVFFLVLGCAVMCLEYFRDLLRLISYGDIEGIK